jgi:hypothetical protein
MADANDTSKVVEMINDVSKAIEVDNTTQKWRRREQVW